MIGQLNIFNYINNKTRDTFPRSLILLGPYGCGKHSICDYIKDKLEIPLINISEKISLDFIQSLYQKPEPYLYLIECSEITIKEQNMLLKLIEEPLKNAYIVLIAESSNQILSTVYNRCQVLRFEPYSKDELAQFTSDELVLKIAETPGEVLDLSQDNKLTDILELTNKIVNKIGTANLPNVLTISDKLAYKNEKNKFSIPSFSKVLNYSIKQKIREDSNLIYIDMYKLIREWNIKRKAPTISQKFLFENLLVKLYNLMKAKQ